MLFRSNLFMLHTMHGTFISLKQLYSTDINTNEQISHVLGYPCIVPFDKINRNKRISTFTIYIEYNENVHTDSKIKIPLFTYMDQTFKNNPDLYRLIERMNICLNINTELSSRNCFVSMISDIVIPINDLIKTLSIPYKSINKHEHKEIVNVIANYEAESLANYVHTNINYDNLIHRGIILSILIQAKHNSIEPLFPLQDSGYKDDIEQIISSRGIEYIKTIEKTK